MPFTRRALFSLCLCTVLAGIIGPGPAAQAQAPAGPLASDPGRPPTPLVLDQATYFQAVRQWVQSVEATSLDPGLPHILAGGRAAAERRDWAAAEAALDNLASAHPPEGMVTLLRGLVAWSRQDLPAHVAALGRAAPELAAAGETDMAVDTWRYLALTAAHAADLAGAERYLAQALSRVPDAAALHFLRGQFAWMRDDHPAAIAAWERTVALAPEDAVAWFTLAEAYTGTGATGQARHAGNEAIRLAPAWVIPRLQVARWLLADGDGQAAFTVLLPLATHTPDLPEARALLSDATRQSGVTPDFSQHAADLRARNASGADWVALGRSEHRQGALENAASAYRAALALEPTQGEYGFLLGGVLGKLWDVEGAVAAYRQALAAGFSPVACQYNLGLMYTTAERYAEAIAAFDASAASGGIPAYVHGGRGGALLRAGRFAEAETALALALEDDPESAVLWEAYGVTLLALEMPRPARRALANAVERQTIPTRSARYWLGRAELAMDRPNAALEAFRHEYELMGSYPELAHWAGVAAQQAGRPALAYLTFNTAIQYGHGMADAWRGMAELDQSGGRLADADRGYQRAEDLGLDSALLHYRRGELAWSRGHLGEARDRLEVAVQRDPDLTAAWQRLGAVQAELGDQAAARQSFARAYGRDRITWFLRRSVTRLFLGALWIASFLLVLILGARVYHRRNHDWRRLFVGRLDLAAVAVLALLVPIVLTLAGQRLLYASFRLQEFTNRQALGFNSFLAFRDGVFLGLLPVAYLWWRHGRPRVGPVDARRLALHVGLGVAGCVAFSVPGLVAHLLEQDVMGTGLLPRTRNFFNATPQNLAASVVGIGVISSAAQEVFYRGVLFRLSREQVGAIVAGIVSALLFGAFHFQAANLWWYVLFGLMAAFLYHRTGSLVAPIVMHVLYNVVQVIV